MALHAVYKQFLAAPSSAALAPNAVLHYITTTTSFYGPTDIIKHLSSQRNQIKKEKDEIITVVEGQDALAVQTELSLEFQDNGGAYLPGLDDQFLYDRVVHIPVVSAPLFIKPAIVSYNLYIVVGKLSRVALLLTVNCFDSQLSYTLSSLIAMARSRPFNKAGTRERSSSSST